MSSAFHKEVQWRFSGVVEKYITTSVDFFQDSVIPEIINIGSFLTQLFKK